MKQKGGILLVLVILILIIGGTFFIFKWGLNSLPGEVLYPIKEFTEELTISTTSLRNSDRANAYIKIASERLNEIERLEEKGEDPANLVKIIERFWETEQKAIAELRKAKEFAEPISEEIAILEELGKRQNIIFKRLLENTPAPEFYTLLGISEKSEAEIANINRLK